MPSRLFIASWQPDSKMCLKCKRPRGAKTNLKKNKVGGLKPSGVMTYCKGIKTMRSIKNLYMSVNNWQKLETTDISLNW